MDDKKPVVGENVEEDLVAKAVEMASKKMLLGTDALVLQALNEILPLFEDMSSASILHIEAEIYEALAVSAVEGVMVLADKLDTVGDPSRGKIVRKSLLKCFQDMNFILERTDVAKEDQKETEGEPAGGE